MKKLYKYIPLILVFVGLLHFSNCGGSRSEQLLGIEYEVTVSWDENHESLLNGPGGGYIVYCSKEPHFSLTDPEVITRNVPYASGALSPTSTTVDLESGTWYIKVVAYMELEGTAYSSPSVQKSVFLP